MNILENKYKKCYIKNVFNKWYIYFANGKHFPKYYKNKGAAKGQLTKKTIKEQDKIMQEVCRIVG